MKTPNSRVLISIESRAVPRLNIPDYDWWSEALHGVALDGTTEFPEPVGCRELHG